MELITNELKEAFKKHPLYSTEETKPLDKEAYDYYKELEEE